MRSNPSDPNQPNPDLLLKQIKDKEAKERRGILKIFLGMSAGVGKTFAMLQEAIKLHKQGIEIVAGVIETHGRQETAALLAQLPQMPRHQIKHKEIEFSELDLDKILKEKPEVVLVDELAHSNIPGSRHEKRWQDVLEILDQGIDVFTTLNVQHVDSLKEFVEHTTGIYIRESVPDAVLEAADHIEIVDITPQKLLDRLKEGKVYLGDKSKEAQQNFFQVNHLSALRQMMFHFMAEKVYHEYSHTSNLEEKKLGKTRERLLVAIAANIHAQKLIRRTKRQAFLLKAPWIALHVQDGTVLSQEEKSILDKNFALARDLGGEVMTVNDTNVSHAIEEVVRRRGVTQIIIGRPPKKNRFQDFFSKQAFLLYRLMHDCEWVDIHVIRKVHPYRIPKKSFFSNTRLFLILAAVLGVSWPIAHFGGHVMAMFWMGFALTVTLFLLLYFRSRNLLQSQMLGYQQASQQLLFDLARSSSLAELRSLVKERLSPLLMGGCEIILKEEEGIIHDEAASWALKNGKEAGLSTSTLASSLYYFVPLKIAEADEASLGLLSFMPGKETQVSMEQKKLLNMASHEIANKLVLLKRSTQ